MKVIFKFNAVIVCLCKSVTDRDLARAIDGGASSLEDVGCATGAGTGCGGCKDNIRCALDMACGRRPKPLIILRSVVKAAIVG